MQSKQTNLPATTRQRLLEAATIVFARDGLAASTTRAIAEEAGVNEVTLFRHFQTKERLLAEVVGQNFGADQLVAQDPLPSPTHDLRADLLALARYFDRFMTSNLPLVRTMIGEIHRHKQEQEKQVYRGIFRPMKSAIVERLEAARTAGELDVPYSTSLLCDLFTSMLFMAALRKASKDLKTEYTSDQYLDAAVELVLHSATISSRGQRA